MCRALQLPGYPSSDRINQAIITDRRLVRALPPTDYTHHRSLPFQHVCTVILGG